MWECAMCDLGGDVDQRVRVCLDEPERLYHTGCMDSAVHLVEGARCGSAPCAGSGLLHHEGALRVGREVVHDVHRRRLAQHIDL